MTTPRIFKYLDVGSETENIQAIYAQYSVTPNIKILVRNRHQARKLTSYGFSSDCVVYVSNEVSRVPTDIDVLFVAFAESVEESNHFPKWESRFIKNDIATIFVK